MTKKLSRSTRPRRQEEREARKKRQRLVTALIIAGSLVALIVIVLLARQITRISPADVTLPESLEPPPNADGVAWGPVDAPVVIEEFSDFQ